MRVVWVGGISFHVAWVCGLFAPLGLEAPFAKAQDVVKVASSVEQITGELKVFAKSTDLTAIADTLRQDRIDRLDQAIQTVRSQQCRTAANSPARQNYTLRLNELFKKYVEVAGREPHVPQCDET